MCTGHPGRTAILLVLAAALALTIVIPNSVLISSNDEAGLALDWQEIKGVAQAAGVPAEELAEQLQPEGARYLVVREDTLDRLKQTGQIQVLTGWELRQLAQIFHSDSLPENDILTDPEFRLQDTYILLANEELFSRLKGRLPQRFPNKVRPFVAKGNNTYGLAVQVRWDQLAPMGIGVSPQEVAAVRALGYEPILAWRDGLKTAGEMELDLSDLAQAQPTVLMPGPLPSADCERVGSALARLDTIQGVPEFDPPVGAAAVAAASGYKTVRVYERPVHTIYQEYLLAVRDRNVRLVILHLLWQVPPDQGEKSLLDANIMHLRNTAAALKAAGMKVGTPKPFVPRQPNRWVTAGLLGLMPAILLDRRRWSRVARMALCIVVALAAVLVSPIVLAWLCKGAAFVIASLLPVDAVLNVLTDTDREPTRAPPLWRGLAALMKASVLTLLGGAIVQGLLGDIDFLLKLNVFSGIKAAYMITFALVLVAAYGEQWRGRDRYWWRQKQIAPVELMALGLLAGAVWVLFNRSGNASIIPIPAWELRARSFLESALYARPRTKEFLVGHPALILAAAGWGKDRSYRPYVLVLAAVGQASLMNTFVHLHTPFVISLARSLLGLGGGALVGAFLLGIIHLLVGRGKQNA